MASPTSCGRGRRAARRFLPATRKVPSGQSISLHCNAATSPARSPKRAKSKSTARSRTPMGVVRSQLASTRSTVSGGRYLGKDAKRQWASVGSAWSRPGGQRPTAMRKRRNIRTALTSVFAHPIPPRPARSRTKVRRPEFAVARYTDQKIEYNQVGYTRGSGRHVSMPGGW